MIGIRSSLPSVAVSAGLSGKRKFSKVMVRMLSLLYSIPERVRCLAQSGQPFVQDHDAHQTTAMGYSTQGEPFAHSPSSDAK